jgi:hypothetical protein
MHLNAARCLPRLFLPCLAFARRLFHATAVTKTAYGRFFIACGAPS